VRARPEPLNLDLSKTAIFVVDMQNDFCAPGGAFDRAGVNIIDIVRRLFPSISQMLRVARGTGVLVIYLKMEHQPKYSKAVESLTANWERLVTFFDFPAEHWKHLRTTNVIESPFATVRLRERATRGAGSRSKGLLMAFKLLDMVQLRWRHLDGAQLLPLVRAGVKFADGVQVDSTKPVTHSTDNQPREAPAHDRPIHNI
jgi:nicotinamidase-related amidase